MGLMVLLRGNQALGSDLVRPNEQAERVSIRRECALVFLQQIGVPGTAWVEAGSHANLTRYPIRPLPSSAHFTGFTTALGHSTNSKGIETSGAQRGQAS